MTVRRKHVVAVGILVGAALAGGPGLPHYQAATALGLSPPTANQRIPGISANINSGFGNGAARSAALQRIAGLGVGIDRIDANWADIEKTKNTYDWSSLDYRVQEANQHGLMPRIILDYGNPLYSSSPGAQVGGSGVPPFGIGAAIFYPPDDNDTGLGAFARWAAALAARYHGTAHGSAYLLEVWNEENLDWRFWEPPPDMPNYSSWYGHLLSRAHDAIKAVAPDDQVAFGGTFFPAIDAASAASLGIPIPAGAAPIALPHRGTLRWVDDALNQVPGLGAKFDALAYHPYHFPYYAPEVNIPTEGTTADSMVAVRALLDSHGLQSKPIWITEVGWPNNTCAYGSIPDKSASYLVRTFTTAWAHGINQVDWYTYSDGGDPTQNCFNQEAAFGIVDYQGNPKPSYYAWATLNRLVLPLPFEADVSTQMGLPAIGHALRFGNATRRVTVVWLAPETLQSDGGPAAPPADARAEVATPPGTTAIDDMRGAAVPVGASFEASPYPVYLVQDLVAPPGSGSTGEPSGGLPNTSR